MMLNKLIKKFKYPLEMKTKIIKHEEEMLNYNRDIIIQRYHTFFAEYKYTLKVGIVRSYMGKIVSSNEEIPLKAGYSCQLYCEVQKNGEIAKILSYDGECEYYLLFAVTEISRIDFPFNNPQYLLFDDTEEFYEDMDELQEIVMGQGSESF